MLQFLIILNINFVDLGYGRLGKWNNKYPNMDSNRKQNGEKE